MSNFNDKIKALLAFSASFEGFKSEVETKLNQLSKPTDLGGLVKKEDLNNSISKLSEELKAAKFDAFAFDSARRTFGEEVGVLKSFVDKGFNELRKELETLKDSDELEFLASALSDLDKQLESVRNSIAKPKSYDGEIKELKTAIAKIPAAKSYDKEIKSLGDKLSALPAPKSYDKELAQIKSSLSGFVNAEQVKNLLAELPKPKDFSADIAKLEVKLKAIKLPADKSLEVESLLSRVRKLEAVKPVDYSQEIVAVKKSIPTQIDNSKDIEALKLSTERQIDKLTKALNEQSKQTQQLKQLLSTKDDSSKALTSLGASVAAINKRVESIASDNAVNTLKSDLAGVNKQLVKLLSDFTIFKSAFEE